MNTNIGLLFSFKPSRKLLIVLMIKFYSYLPAQNLVINGSFNYTLPNGITSENCTTGHLPFFRLDSNFSNWHKWSLGAHYTIEECNCVAGLSGDGVIQGVINPVKDKQFYILEFDILPKRITKNAQLEISFNNQLTVFDTLFPFYEYLMVKPHFSTYLKTTVIVKPNKASKNSWIHKKLLVITDTTLTSIHFELFCKNTQIARYENIYIDNVNVVPVDIYDIITPSKTPTLKSANDFIYVLDELSLTSPSTKSNTNYYSYTKKKAIIINKTGVQLINLSHIIEINKDTEIQVIKNLQ